MDALQASLLAEYLEDNKEDLAAYIADSYTYLDNDEIEDIVEAIIHGVLEF